MKRTQRLLVLSLVAALVIASRAEEAERLEAEGKGLEADDTTASDQSEN